MEIGGLWNAHLLEERHGNMTVDVIVDTRPITSAGPAINVAEMALFESLHQGSHLACESVVSAIAR
jgi:hypothetical protein